MKTYKKLSNEELEVREENIIVIKKNDLQLQKEFLEGQQLLLAEQIKELDNQLDILNGQ